MRAQRKHHDLPPRERQIMDILYQLGESSVSDVQNAMPKPAPSYSSVRALLNLLEQKGHLKLRAVGKKYLYRPTVSKDATAHSVLKQLLGSMFDGSPKELAAELLNLSKNKPTKAEFENIAKLVEHNLRKIK